MEDLQIFTNEEFGTVRGMLIDDEPWFVGKDVTEILGYQNSSEAIADHIDDEDKLNSKLLSSLGQRGGWLINESGLYSLILSSKLPETKKFKRWVTAEVLPAIRKHHVYAMDDMLNNPDALIEALQAYKVERQQRLALEEENAIQKQQLIEMRPKASYYDIVLNAPNLVATSVIAKDYGWSAQRLNEFLHNARIQYKQGKIWLLYQQYAELGLTSTKTHAHPAPDGTLHTSIFTYWTPRGRLFIYDLLKQNGILPIIERMGGKLL